MNKDLLHEFTGQEDNSDETLIINLVEYLYEDYIGFFNMMSDNLIYSSLKNTPEFTNKHIFQLITDIFKDY